MVIIKIKSVAKEYRHKGLGEALLKTAISEARRRFKVKIITLEANADNIYAIRLYRHCGFQRAGLIKGARLYCGKYVDRITMVRYFF